jgi:hypothetical protein
LANIFKSSPPKPLGEMNRNLVGSIYGMFSINIVHFIPIRLQKWPPQAILHVAAMFANRTGQN